MATEPKPRVYGRVRQADIARSAGVSQATVSIVLGGRDDGVARISEARRQHILEVARELGYSVNPVARSLAGGRNRLLGVYTFEKVFPIVGRDFYQEFLLGIEHEAEQVGYDLLLFTSASMPGQRRSIYGGGVNRLALADGSILLGRQDEKEEIARLAIEGFPFVYIGRREVAGTTLSYVTADYGQATGHVVDHLAGRGHRRLVYLGVTTPREPDLDREGGWTASLARNGLTAGQAPVLRPASFRGLKSTLARLHARDGVTAVVVEDPEAAPRVFAAAERAGLRVPQDLSVAVLGDDPSVVASEENWTGFRIPREEMGREAVRLLIGALESPDMGPRHVTVPCPFVQGKTVSAVRSARKSPPRQATRRSAGAAR